MGVSGGYMFLRALSLGPLSLASSVHSLYVVVTAIIGYLLYKEKLTVYRIFLILLAVIAVIVIRLG